MHDQGIKTSSRPDRATAELTIGSAAIVAAAIALPSLVHLTGLVTA
ncbi:hypothetical protein GS504_15980 [Rhodococcus hoagii]|nr:hypothetical protein [Prescottella equi]NKR94265.1 hypothetical protein [Prescottella equi]NKS58952.1 hypothetical protein [Prescottella equi]NKS69390.1 hypothetical protein [Prescottella equi]